MPSQLDLPSVTDFVAFSILYYDFLLTFGKEVEFFWTKPRKSWAFALFMTNRYVTILSHIHPYLEIFWPLNEGEDGALSVVFCDRDRLTDIRYSCRIADVYDQFEIIVVQIIGGGIMIMRVYALYEKSRRVLFFLVAYALICIGIGCWSVLAPSSSDSPPVPTPPLHYGCNVPITFDQAQHMAIAWSGQLAFDAIIFLLTLSRTLRIGKLGNRTLLDVLIRDGALYFGIMTAANAGNITAFLVCQTSAMKSMIASFTNIISATMISRLMLNLRDPKIVGQSQLLIPSGDDTLLVTTVVAVDFTCPSRYADEPTLELQRMRV